MIRSSSICLSFLYNYLTTDGKDSSDTHDKKIKTMRSLTKTLEGYGGVLSKLSQILSLNNESSTVFSDCKPFSKEQTTVFFKKNCPKSIVNVDYNVFKSGSVGQVYRAIYKEKPVIFKVQYVGLQEQTIKDLEMLDMIGSYLYSFCDIKNAMVDINKKMQEELDYKLEASNQRMMYKLWKNSDIVEIPKIIKKLSGDKIICMRFIKGQSLSDFIQNSTQDEKNIFGMCVVRFVFESMYKYGILYSDIHYGNLIVKDNGTLCVLDFGCLNKIEKNMLDNFKRLYKSILEKNREYFYTIVEDMGIINKNISKESKDYIYEYFVIQYTPWISDEFEFTNEWLEISTNKKTELMNEWTLPKDLVYFNKIPYGGYHIFTKLKLKGRFKKIFEELMI
jgi:predicted unusual protein kinase regulating ubiquinone biosynthesis (AarF/ABC1/UbiB family)